MKRRIADENGAYAGEFYAVIDGMEEEDEEFLGGAAAVAPGEKKRRLSVEQVRALERSFEVENKLEPERKARLAEELGMQQRQVAVWFQNRRARWKTKQLERDYAALKASHDALRLDVDGLHRDKAALLSQIEELKAKLTREESLSFSSVKEEPTAAPEEEEPPPEAALIYKGGSSDSDSSAVLNSPRQAAAALGSSTSSVPASAPLLLNQLDQSQHMLKMEAAAAAAEVEEGEEEEQLLGRDEAFSNLFADEQPPTLNWYYYPEHWN